MKTFIINLENAHLRRERIRSALTAVGIDFEFFRAVTPADNPNCYFSGFDHRTIRLETLRNKVSATEIACYASHMLLWQKCTELNQPIVILEDDLEPTSCILDVYAVLEDLTTEFGFIRLDPPWLQPNYFRGGFITEAHTLRVAERGSVKLTHPTFFSLGSGAYAISPATAEHWVKASLNRTFSCPVDNFIRRTWQHRQPVFYIEPEPYKLNDRSKDSQIDGRDIGRSDSKLLRKMRKLPLRLYHWWARQACRKETARVRSMLQLDRRNAQAGVE